MLAGARALPPEPVPSQPLGSDASTHDWAARLPAADGVPVACLLRSGAPVNPWGTTKDPHSTELSPADAAHGGPRVCPVRAVSRPRRLLHPGPPGARPFVPPPPRGA